MKALSVRLPWAWLLFHGKDVENRPWRLWESVIGKTVAIHASRPHIEAEFEAARRLINERRIYPFPEAPEAYSYGHIIGTLRFTADVTESGSPWFVGPHGFVRADARLLSEPIPCKGALGFWNVPPEIAARIAAEASR